MKKLKSFLSLCLALGFLFPSFACAASGSTPPTSNDPSTDTSVDSSADPSAGSSADSSGDFSPESSNTTPPNSSASSSAPTTSSTPEGSTPPALSANAQYILCTGDGVNLRAGAGTEYAVLGSAAKGTMYAVIGKTGSWYKTYYRNKIAYIYTEYASVFTLKKAENENVEKVVEEGYKLLGVPYVYGAVRLHDGKGNFLKGFSAQKFDCSSLVQYAFYQGNKTLLNTTTRTQVKQGKYVAKSDIRRGDCLFFTNEDRQYNTGIERVGHVAIYLGDNYILHTSSDYARIEKISAKRWKFYIEARRFV